MIPNRFSMQERSHTDVFHTTVNYHDGGGGEGSDDLETKFEAQALHDIKQ